jgi:hypothetical protein
MREPTHTEEYRGYTINLYPDGDVESPREWDNLTTLAFFTSNLRGCSDGKEHHDELGELLADLLWEMYQDKYHGVSPSKVRFKRLRYDYVLKDGRRVDEHKWLDSFVEWDDFEYDLRHGCKYATRKALHMLKDYIWIESIKVYEHSGYALSFYSWRGRLPQGHYEFDTYIGGVAYMKLDKLRQEYNTKRLTKQVMARAEKCAEAELETFNMWLNGDCQYYEIVDPDGEEKDSCGGYIGMDDCIKDA